MPCYFELHADHSFKRSTRSQIRSPYSGAIFFYRQKAVIANKPITNPMMTPVGSLEVPLEVPPDNSVAAD